MTAPWPQVSIGSVCRLVNGRPFKPSDWSTTGLPIVRIQNLNDHDKPFNCFDGRVDAKHLIDSGDVLLSWSGTPGTSFGCFIWTRGCGILNQHIFKVEVDASKMLKEFFVHAVNERLDEMIGLAHGGVGLRHITKGKLEAIKVGVPSLDVQKRVVERVREFSVRIDEIKRLRLDAQSQAISVSSAALGDAEQGLSAPRRPLAELVLESRNGRSIKSSGDGGNGAVLTLAAVRSPIVDLERCKSVDFDVATGAQFAVRSGDVFVSRANTVDFVGLSAIVEHEPPERLIFPDLLIRLLPDVSRVRAKYLTYALRFPLSRKQIRERAVGSSQSMVKVSGERFREVKIPVPELDVQDRLVARLDGLLKVSSDLCERLAAESARDSLLPAAVLRKAFAGDL
jgi:type I restriction enzyme, S subunit